MIAETLRESGKGESRRPTPQGDFDGLTKVEALDRLINPEKYEAPEREPFLHRFARALTFGLVAGIIWVGPKLTPQEAADVLRPNQTRFPAPCERCEGPYIFVLDSSTSSGPFGSFTLHSPGSDVSRVWSGHGVSTRRVVPLLHMPQLPQHPMGRVR